jgi:hypothetical protein
MFAITTVQPLMNKISPVKILLRAERKEVYAFFSECHYPCI